MKDCYQCGKLTAGEPLYCNHCGRSYDVKLCPRHHQNPRGAEGCSQCGSRELSTPQPKLPMSWRLAALLLQFVLGILLVYGSLSLLIATPPHAPVPAFLVATGLLVGGGLVVLFEAPGLAAEAHPGDMEVAEP
jgi:hypothetical protein